MYQSRTRILSVLVFVLFTFCAASQDAKDKMNTDFESIANRVDSSSSVSIKVQANIYSLRGGSKISSTTASRFQRDEEYVTQLAELEIIETKKFAVRVDHEEKSLLVLEKQKSGKKIDTGAEQLDLSALKKFLEENEKQAVKPQVQLVSESSSIRKYRITKVSGFIAIEIEVDFSKVALRNVSFEYGSINDPGQFVDLDYTMHYNTNVDSEFDLAKYFNKKNGEITLSTKLTGYKLYTEL